MSIRGSGLRRVEADQKNIVRDGIAASDSTAKGCIFGALELIY